MEIWSDRGMGRLAGRCRCRCLLSPSLLPCRPVPIGGPGESILLGLRAAGVMQVTNGGPALGGCPAVSRKKKGGSMA
jgi:hypothetical protein